MLCDLGAGTESLGELKMHLRKGYVCDPETVSIHSLCDLEEECGERGGERLEDEHCRKPPNSVLA